MKNKYLFIGGTGRSGTNITREIFASHPSVASFPFEYRFIIDPDGLIDFYLSMMVGWSPYMSDVKIKRLRHFLENLGDKSSRKRNYIDWELSKWFPNYFQNVENLINELILYDYDGYWPGATRDSSPYRIGFVEYKPKQELAKIIRRFIKNNIDDFTSRNEKYAFVEDNTWNILYAKELHELMPESKLIHVVRDPRDVIASFMSQRWCPSDFNEALAMYKSIMSKWLEVESRLPIDFFKIIKLEDLVANPEDIIREMCLFSGISFHREMLNIKLNKPNTNRWKNELTNENINVIKSELKFIIDKFNYAF